MRHALSFAFALTAAAAFAAGCSGGGGGGLSLPGSPAGAIPPGSPISSNIVRVAMTIKIPTAVSSAARHAQYVSPGTQSIGVVVTNQAATASPAQFVNVSSCPTVSGVVTCTVTVQANPGNDSFAVTAYSGTNGTGSALSVGSITSSIVAGVANTTMPLTLGGVVASISIVPGNATLPLGQSTNLAFVAKDASGAAIVGTFDNPIVVTGSNANLTFSSTSITNSNDASHVNAAWKYGFGGSTATTVTGAADGVTGTLAITPGTGIAYYTTGTNATYDNDGFKAIIGPDGKLYYTTLGIVSCTNNNVVCTSQAGAIHQFDPSTAIDTEVDVQSEAVGMHFMSDGSLWFAGGVVTSSGAFNIYRMAPGAFSASALTPIAVPTPAVTHGRAMTRTMTQDSAGNVWFANLGGNQVLKIPLAGPYTASSITAYPLPTIAPTVGFSKFTSSRTLDFVGGSLVATSVNHGSVIVINPATGAAVGEYPTLLQASYGSGTLDSTNPYDSTTDGTLDYIANLGQWNQALPQGDLEAFNPSTHAFTTVPVVHGPASTQPTVPSVNGANLYTADFSLGGFDYTNLTTGAARFVPVITTTNFALPANMAVASDGTAWFTCYGSAPVFQPICVGHTVYLGNWSIFPSQAINLIGAGLGSAQIMGVMEAPSANSGPFTVTSSNTAVCTIASNSDHNFFIVGQSAGACLVTVTDKNSVSQTINVTVTTTSGTVQARPAAGGLK